MVARCRRSSWWRATTPSPSSRAAERRRVVFRLEGETVTVSRADHHDEEVELFTVGITKPDPNTGRSRPHHSSDATTPKHPVPWQVLRHALELLFFPG